MTTTPLSKKGAKMNRVYPDDRMIVKVKMGKKVEIRWIDLENNGAEMSLSTSDRPLPEFWDSLQVLTSLFILEFLELPQDYASTIKHEHWEGEYKHESKFKVVGLTLAWEDCQTIKGFCTTSLRSLESFKAPLVLNTPWLETEGMGLQVITDALQLVALYAQRFLDGERDYEVEQLGLFSSTEEANNERP